MIQMVAMPALMLQEGVHEKLPLLHCAEAVGIAARHRSELKAMAFISASGVCLES